VNARNTDGKTSLYIASQNGHVEVFQELVQNDKVKVNAQRTHGATALHMASQNGHVYVVRLLRQNNKVDVNARCINS
jgi:ankyrin repeat protein